MRVGLAGSWSISPTLQSRLEYLNKWMDRHDLSDVCVGAESSKHLLLISGKADTVAPKKISTKLFVVYYHQFQRDPESTIDNQK